MNEPRISVIIVSFNSKRWLNKCLDSLYCQTYKNFEVVVVDNNSSDGSADYIEKEYPSVRLMKSEKNLGFAGGVNLGIKNSLGGYILMLNPDAWLKEDFLEKIFKFYRENNFDVVGPLEAEYDGSQAKNSNFVSKIDPFGFSVLVSKNKTKCKEQFNLCGFCLFFKKQLYLETGELDSDFFMYIEEIDWFWRLALFGKKVGLTEDLLVHHAGDDPEDGIRLRKNVFIWRNRNILRMMLKNYSRPNLFWILPLYFVQNLAEAAVFLLMLKPKIALSYLDGWWFNIKRFDKIMAKRKQIQRNRKISDWRFFKKFGYFGIGKIKLLFNLRARRYESI